MESGIVWGKIRDFSFISQRKCAFKWISFLGLTGVKASTRREEEIGLSYLTMSPLRSKRAVLFTNICQTNRQAGRQLWRQMNDATPSAPWEMRSGIGGRMDRSPPVWPSNIQSYSVSYNVWATFSFSAPSVDSCFYVFFFFNLSSTVHDSIWLSLA